MLENIDNKLLLMLAENPVEQKPCADFRSFSLNHYV